MAKNKPWDLKYRPRVLEDTAGHRAVVNQLTQMIRNAEDTLPNALMFVGGSGRGKTTLARMIARYLNCEKGTSCGKCDSCKAIDSDSHPDYAEYNAAEHRGIDAIRSITAKAKFKPRNKVRVILLDECHMLTKEAANALLKPLEEPPADTIWILATTNPEMIPNSKAVCGRCAVMNLAEPNPKDIASRLADIAKAEKIKVFTDEALLKLASASGGHIRDAVKMLEAAWRLIEQSGKAKKLKDKELNKFIDDVTTKLQADDIEMDAIAIKILVGIYTDDVSMIISAIMDTKDYVPLAIKMIYLNKYLMYTASGCTNSKYVWHTPTNKKFIGLINKSESCKGITKRPDEVVRVHDAIIQLRHALVTTAGVDGSDLYITRLGQLGVSTKKKKK
ncbi:putative DNA polymerase III [Vibrio phage vB_VcorM_GR7B]|nr:putative DNA polymerase III [Vibrio phage vB_VcorM_GR7B]